MDSYSVKLNQQARRSKSRAQMGQRKSPSHLQKRWQPKPPPHYQSMRPPYEKPVVLLSPIEQETILRQRALLETQQGNHAEAIDIFGELIDRSPSNASHYSNRGLVYFKSGQLEAAMTDYNHAIALNPRLDSAYNNRANFYAAQGLYLEAILDYDVALDLNPANVRAWINQGITFREVEMYDRALESLDLALCLGKLEGHVYAERGRTYHLRGDWNCAVGEYQRALEQISLSDLGLSDSAASTPRLRLQIEAWLEELLSPLNPA